MTRPHEIKIEHSLASDDSCRMQLFAKGHHDEESFLKACRIYLRRWDGRTLHLPGKTVSRLHWRTVPIKGNIVCDAIFRESKPGPGAYPVTVMNEWQELHRIRHRRTA